MNTRLRALWKNELLILGCALEPLNEDLQNCASQEGRGKSLDPWIFMDFPEFSWIRMDPGESHESW